VAAAPGKVVQASNSVVLIQHANGITSGYMHLANIKVSVGATVAAGNRLGNPSCLAPTGGSTSGIHLHFYLMQGGARSSIVGTMLSGWRIDAARTSTGAAINYNGTMTKAGVTRTANAGRCNASHPCGSIRNDIPAP